MLLFLLAFILGLSLSRSFIVIGIIYLIFFLWLCLHQKKKKLSLLSLLIFAIGVGISYIHISYNNRSQFDGIVYEVKDNYFLFNSGGEKLYCYEKNHHYEIGDILLIKGKSDKYDFIMLESDFNFNNYLRDKGVYKELIIDSISYKFKTPIRLKSFRNYFLNKFDESTKVSIGALLFSDHDDNELSTSINSLHLYRLFSAGGLFFHAFISIFTYLLSIKIKNKWAKLIPFIFLSFYIVISFYRFSLIRLSFIYLFKWINEYVFKKKISYINILSISALFFLMIDYHLVYQDSFILGFGIPIYLYFINNSFTFMKKWRKRLFTILLLYLFFIPFELKYYNSLSPLSAIYQIILSPIFILFFLIGLFSLYGIPLYGLANIYNSFLSNLMKSFTYISININAPILSPLMCLFYYLLLFIFIYYNSIRFKPLKKLFLTIYLSSLVLYVLPIKNQLTAEVVFINVGQGDCTYIRYHNSVILIDTGGLKYKDLALDCLIPFLKKKRVYDIDLVITTHDDYDHNGALPSLINNFKVKKTMTNTNYKPISFNNIKFTNYNNHINESKEDNDKSLIIGFHLMNKDFLIMGDASIQNEKYLMNEYNNIPCDILHVGHHGSKTSSSYEFIKWLSPTVGIISCGKNNKYGHPHQEVITNLNRLRVKIRRTDIEGSITYIAFAL